MRPALWIVRFSGEFPHWRVRHVADTYDGELPGWYADCPSMGWFMYAETPTELRKVMALRERRYARGR